MSAPKFPEVEVELSGQDGNAFVVMAKVSKAMRDAKIDKADIDAYRDAAMSGDYNNLLAVTFKTVTVN